MSISALHKLFADKPYLAWYVKDTNSLSDESLVEHILNYGKWEDYLLAERELGIDKVRQIFMTIKGKKRVNLRPQTINYFENYFHKYA